ncbi:hypothetical protein [Rhizobium rhizogenes]|uniref:hypothetical protein n=1 Tax=Rhizobium rhizogenes TaxID=359 RepID=UPI002270E75E|nr:hypothetical protein [Rhizobium rhizogenes]
MQVHPIPLETETAGSLLHARLRRSPVSSAIDSHQNAVKVDEAQFDDAGVPFNAAAAVETLSEEVRLFRDFCQLPCETADDVQAKIRYLLHGTVGERTSLIESLISVEYGFADASEGLTLMLKSLLVPASPRERTHAHVAPGTRAREEHTNG